MNTFLRTLIPAALLLSGCYVTPAVRVRVQQTTPPLTIDMIERLANAGVSDSVIVDEIRARGMSARPTADQIVALKKEGVGDAVLQAMNEAPIRSGQAVVVDSAPWPPPYPVYDPYLPYYYGPWWSGGLYWGWSYPYRYYSPYGRSRVFGGPIRRLR